MSGSVSGDLQEQRWSEAESILQQAPTTSAVARLRQRRVMGWLLRISALLLLTGLGILVSRLLIAHHAGASSESVPTWQSITGLVITISGVAIEAVGLVVMRRAGQLRNRWRSPTAVLTRPQRRSLARQVTGRAPVDPRRLRLAQDLARRVAGMHSMIAVYIGLVVAEVGQAVGLSSAGWTLFTGALVVVFLLSLVLLERQVRVARRFLARHPLPAEHTA